MASKNRFPGMNPYGDLQLLIDQAYRLGRYDDIDYRREPVPTMNAEDALWAAALLKEKGSR